jgi:hypothetical protein
MSHSNTVLNQVMQLIPRHQFETIVNHHGGNHYVKRFDCWNQLTTLLYAQASGKESLREIEQGLAVNDARLYHLGLPGVKRSTLADANQTRNFKIFESLFYKLLTRCQGFTSRHGFKFNNPLYSIDATIIDLCLSSFNWAKFRTAKGGIKLHYQFNHSGQIPEFLVITDAKAHETTVMKRFFTLVADSIYCFDRAYNDFVLYRRITQAKAFFVTRAKDNLDFQVIGQHTQALKKGILSDEIIQLNNPKYTEPLRMIRFYDSESGGIFVFITNNFKLAPYTITQIYKSRWQIEIFFRWIKQNLKIKTFLGTNQNAVMTQIWVAMCYFLILAYIKYQTRFKRSLFYLHKMVQDTLLARLTLIDLLRATPARLQGFKSNEYQYAFL